MMKSFFSSLSYIFHPIFLPLMGLYFLFELPTKSLGLMQTSLYYTNPDAKNALYILFGFLTLAAPGISILIMKLNGIISSYHIVNRKERIYPLALVALYYILSYYFLQRMIPEGRVIPYLLPYVFGFTMTLIVAFILNFYIKISLHMMAFFGIVGAIMGYFQNQLDYNLWFLLFLILVGGLVGSSRLYLKAHNIKEVILGIVFGFGIEYICMKFDLYI